MLFQKNGDAETIRAEMAAKNIPPQLRSIIEVELQKRADTHDFSVTAGVNETEGVATNYNVGIVYNEKPPKVELPSDEPA